MTKFNRTYCCIFLSCLLIPRCNAKSLPIFYERSIKREEGSPARDRGGSRRIIDGVEVVRGRYPYQVGLIDSRGIFCGGTLIDPQWVLSAAHCAGIGSKVEIGRHDLSNSSEIYESINISFEIVHPEYNPSTLEHDIMLIRLETPSNYSTVTLDQGSTELIPGSNVTVMGWGVTEPGSEDLSDLLLEVEVQVVDNVECQAAYIDSRYDVTDDMICASGQGKDSCQGDSGGPLLIKGGNSTLDIQVGVVSWGSGCADPEFPGVYARVSDGIEFITSIRSCEVFNESHLSTCCQVLCIDGVLTCNSDDDLFCFDDDIIDDDIDVSPCSLFFPFDDFDYSNCTVSRPCWLGDDYCDYGLYNTPECNYDGGDCCKDTCSNTYGNCGSNGFGDCRDPNARVRLSDILWKFYFTLSINFSTVLENLDFLCWSISC